MTVKRLSILCVSLTAMFFQSSAFAVWLLQADMREPDLEGDGEGNYYHGYYRDLDIFPTRPTQKYINNLYQGNDEDDPVAYETNLFELPWVDLPSQIHDLLEKRDECGRKFNGVYINFRNLRNKRDITETKKAVRGLGEMIEEYTPQYKVWTQMTRIGGSANSTELEEELRRFFRR